MFRRTTLFTVLAALLLSSGCVYVDAEPAEDGSAATANTPPSPVLQAQGGPFEAGDRITVDASGTIDRDGDELTYAWAVTDATGADLLFDRASSRRAIEFAATRPSPFEVTVTVEDGVNSPVQSTLTIQTDNRAPSISVATCSQPSDLLLYQRSGDTLRIELGSSQTLCLDASSSRDPEDHALTYHWVTTATPETASETVVDGERIRIDANQQGVYTGFVEASDEFGATSSVDWTVIIR